jgi:hypothetical protein
MKIKVTESVEKEVSYLTAKCGVRYWEDATVNGVEDLDGSLIPCRDGDYWCPIINLETGRITNWEKGIEADIHYKVCDDGEYWLLDSSLTEVIKATGYYVPNMMCPNGKGYGDYVIMNVDGDGYIKNFKIDWDKFLDD